MNVTDRPKVIFIIIIALVIILFGIMIVFLFSEKKRVKHYTDMDDYNEQRTDVNHSSNKNTTQHANNTTQTVNQKPEENIPEVVEDSKEQVYNLGSNTYTYADARAACEAHDGRLAKLNEVIEAYKKGADWCNYGWTEGQIAVFPTQKKTFDKLQQGPKENRLDCGTVGVNGGYFENPNYYFGANCYGIKPKPKNGEIMKTQEIDENELRVREFRSKLDKIKVLPFSHSKWSQYQ